MSGNWVYDEPSLRDFISLVLFSAPDEFPVEDYLSPDDQLTLDKAFDELREGLQYAKTQNHPDVARHARSLLDRAYEAYSSKSMVEASSLIRELERCLGFGVGSSHGYGERTNS